MLPVADIQIAPPPFRARRGGIHSVAPLGSFGTAHEALGVLYATDASALSRFITLDPDDCLATEAKVFDGVEEWERAAAFTIYASMVCTALTNHGTFEEAVVARLNRGREYAIEQQLWDRTFPERAVDLNPAGALSPVRAIGLLEEYAGTHYLGKPVVHIGLRGAAAIEAAALTERVDSGYETKSGSDLVLGAGYVDVDGPFESELASPVLTKGATGAGGAFAAGTYFWVVTAIDADGETLASNEVTATLLLNQQQVLNWVAIAGATGYKVYRGTAAGAEDRLVTTLGAVITYTDTGTAGTADTPPTENDTDKQIAAGAGNVWVYITGMLEIRAGTEITHEIMNPTDNQLYAITEQAVVATVDTVVAAVRMSLPA